MTDQKAEERYQMKRCFIAAAILAATCACENAQDRDGLATVPETVSFVMHSETVGADFQISVSFPFFYRQMPEARFPVLYVLDAWWTFGMATDIARVLSADQVIPQMLVVGVGYPGGIGEAVALRTRDMTLRKSEEVEEMIATEIAPFGPHPPLDSGGSDEFLRFLRDELIPRIESDYRAAFDRRVLHGHSLGGVFVVDAVFREPGIFTEYIASAPFLVIDGGLSFANEAEYSAAHESVPAGLYVAVGENDLPGVVASVTALSDTLQTRDYEDLRWMVTVLDDETHRSLMPVVLRDGLRWIFD
jgi:predicted alpha/beta superfamily hydrolase